MRITKIKLAGFKSFVDPTTLSLPGNLTGVVGPNGCGKSNIIDAMMWVMGESSAKHLRGDSMADVIFSGSNSRKPVGQASVEIVFDNSDGTLGGQYAGFGEISIRRSMSRDAVSTYELNGTKCRRKDITNVFLGTGLGTRGGYSVIEQGMISRVVEAKPEELRGFLEEAAGISKYKERRRETENRIRHTKENLERLGDIREELDKQLGHLQRQARAAERYQKYKEEERLWEAQSMAVRWRDIDRVRANHANDLNTFETAAEAAISDLREIESAQTQQREAQTEATDIFNRVQSDFYAHSAEISRLENALQSSEERKGALEQELERNRLALQDIVAITDKDEDQLRELTAALAEAEPALSASEHDETVATEALQGAEQQLNNWQRDWDAYNTQRSELAREERAEQVRLEHLNEGISGAETRLVALEDERADAKTDELDNRIAAAASVLRARETVQDELLVERDQLREALQQARSEAQQANEQLHGQRRDLESEAGRLASMRALQEAALGSDSAELNTWLDASAFADAPRLVEQMDIERGWEIAVETALRIPLDALCKSGSVGLSSAIGASELPGKRVSLVDDSANGESLQALPDIELLSTKVNSRWASNSALAGVYIAETEQQARTIARQLRAHESVITREGVWIGPDWIQLAGKQESEDSVLERERAIHDCSARIDVLNGSITEIQAVAQRKHEYVQQTEAKLASIERRLDDLSGVVSDAKSELVRIEAAREQIVERHESLANEVNTLTEKTDADREQLSATSQRLDEINARLERLASRHDELDGLRHTLQEAVDSARLRWREAREAHHQLALNIENLRSTKRSLENQTERNTLQQVDLRTRCNEIETALTAQTEPERDLNEKLKVALSNKLRLESDMNTAREKLAGFESTAKENDEKRMLAEQTVEERKQILDQARLEERTIQVRLQDLEGRIEETDCVLTALLEELPSDLDEQGANEHLERVRTRISRLGAINLAAIDEFSQLSERKEYLDKQHGDLIEALETLEGAIRKIDRETRNRFKETFDKVNTGFQNLFPVLFGGGQAYLELLGEDLLDTGVTVMARPPGKRNSTIHLLSGGEKALTALAFVFSLFELNPAPFCLLDEVDAPLDDHNVVRLSDMLKSMSKQVQFMFVTHNKITMEIAEQLIGVTMQEAGVSRLVSVNMEEAVEMVASA